MTRDRIPWGWLIIAAVVVASSPTWLAWVSSAPEGTRDGRVMDAAQAPAVLPPAALTIVRNQELFVRGLPDAGRPTGWVDPVARAPDLKRVFDAYKDSTDVRERRAALRAFQICVPAFVETAGTPPPPRRSATSAEMARSQRDGAYRALFERCREFRTVEPAALRAASAALRADAQAQAPGFHAQQAALAGDFDRMEQFVSAALTSDDPASVASLAGLAVRMAGSRASNVEDAMAIQRAQAVDEALLLVACDLGIDCREDSVWALQLCAIEGLCEGDASARLVERTSLDGISADAVMNERSRLLRLLKTDRILGTRHLLARE
jgi:hypothetical protein